MERIERQEAYQGRGSIDMTELMHSTQLGSSSRCDGEQSGNGSVHNCRLTLLCDITKGTTRT
jgi:hypothetical protein